jgi:acetolactate synthase I/II/III large subunit
MRVADYIANACYGNGIRHVFMVTGGAAMHLNDAFAAHHGLSIHPLHHEQSCSMAADAFARVSNSMALVNVTAGPGGINALNGVFGAYVDSLPMIVVSGQAKRSTMLAAVGNPQLRQLGDQEVDIISMVKGITKYAVVLDDPSRIRWHVEKALYEATNQRPGPVWLDVPIDIQAMEMDFSELDPFNSSILIESQSSLLSVQLEALVNRLRASKRPVLYVGSGVRLAGVQKELLDFATTWGIPVVTGWNSNDLLWDDHPCYAGRPGSVGNRSGNFTVQFSDCLIVLGCRLNIRQVSYNWDSFADRAWICHVDIDQAELDKPTLHSDLKICCGLADFMPSLASTVKEVQPDTTSWKTWCRWCHDLVVRYPVGPTVVNQSPDRQVNPYDFIHILTEQLQPSETVVCADGTACVVGFQAAVIKQGQRLFHNSGCASMGYDLPAAIGAHFATGKRVICLAGDGSVMMNIQELTIISGLRLPILVFVLNNQGYHSIRQTQRNYFPGNTIGCGLDSGLPFPSFESLASGFGLPYSSIHDEQSMEIKLQQILANESPCLVEVMLDLTQDFAPKISSRRLEDGSMVSSRLEDMSPFLPPDQLAALWIECESVTS